MSDTLARLRWKAKFITGKEGHGNWMPLASAEAAVERGNRKYQNIEHWIEVKPDDAT